MNKLFEGEGYTKNALEFDKELKSLNSGRIWITDAVISVAISDKGIVQCDYHGTQPVSHNAKMLVGSSECPALSFCLAIDGKLVENQKWKNSKIRATPWLYFKNGFIENSFEFEEYGFVQGRSLFIGLRLKDKHKHINSQEVSVRLVRNSFYKNGHGGVAWSSNILQNAFVYKGETRYGLADWVEKRGVFLVPPKLHNKVYGVPIGVDANNLDMQPPMSEEVRQSDELIFDSRVYMALSGGENFYITQSEEYDIVTSRFSAEKGCFSEWNYFIISFGETQTDALMENERLRSNHHQIAIEQIARYETVYRNAPKLKLDNHKVLEKIFSWVPMVVESTKQPINGMTRGSASSYYWLWGWDNLVTAHELSKWGDLYGQKKIIEFFKNHRWIDGSIPHRYDRRYDVLQSRQYGTTDCLYISLVYQYYCDSKDLNFLEQLYPVLLRLFEGLNERANENGLISGLGFYPDAPEKIGRTSRDFIAIETGTYYFAVMIIKAIADIMGDNETVYTAEAIANVIAKSFNEAFLDSEKMAIMDHRDFDGLVRNKTYPLYSYMAGHNRFGMMLFSEKQKNLAEFFENNYISEYGILCLPSWDKYVGTEPVHVSWYLHWDIYAMKILAGYATNDVAKHYVDLIEKMWERFGAIHELVQLNNIDTEKIWLRAGQAWNVNCTTGFYRTIIESIVGITTDFGDITVIQLSTALKAELYGLFVSDGRWNVLKEGTGKYIDYLLVDDIRLEGTLKIPKELITMGKHQLKIIYTDTPKSKMRILDILGDSLTDYEYNSEKIRGSLAGCGQKQIIVETADINTKPYIRIVGTDKIIEGKPISIDDGHYIFIISGETNFELFTKHV